MTNDDTGAIGGRWRLAILAVAALFACAMLAEITTPIVARAGTERERGAALADAEAHQLREAKKRKRDRQRRGVEPEIIGGKAVSQGNLTFMALVLIDGADGTVQCGGSLITPAHVLTAAHCATDDEGNDLAPGAFTLLIGAANINHAGPGNTWGVTGVFTHPDWNPETFANDVAVLKLNAAVPGDVASPVPFVGSGQTAYDAAGQTVDVAGWGITERGFPTSTLLRTSLTVVSDGSCQGAYAAIGQSFDPAVMLCAEFARRDSCQGDSGGPLLGQEFVGLKTKRLKKSKHRKKRKKKIPIYSPVQSGIVSWGVGCADPAFPGVYTRLSAPGINDFVVQAINSG